MRLGDEVDSVQWGSRLQKAVHRIEGLAMTFVSELQHFKHYIEEKEVAIEVRFHQWKEHVQHFPEELKKRILMVQDLIKEQVANGTRDASYMISNNTYTRVRLSQFQYYS